MTRRRYPHWPFVVMITLALILCALSVPLNSPFMFIGGSFTGMVSLTTLD